MKKTLILALLPAAIMAQACYAADVALTTPEQKTGYVLGLATGEQMQSQGVKVDQAAFSAGLSDAMTKAKPRMTEEELRATFAAFQEDMKKKQAEMKAKQEKEQAEAGKKNLEEGKKFLAENAKKEGVKTTKSGLQYKSITEGTGPKPTATDMVTVNYRGTTIDGTEFDSSYKRGQPATFALNAVIPGWTEALQLMPKGSKYQVVIPSDLAYGPGGTGGPIGPNATLVFEVELMDIAKPEAKSAAPAAK